MRFNKDHALLAAGLIFGIVALAHMLRLFMPFNLLIARQLVPIWVSLPVCLLFVGLSCWMFAARATNGKRSR